MFEGYPTDHVSPSLLVQDDDSTGAGDLAVHVGETGGSGLLRVLAGLQVMDDSPGQADLGDALPVAGGGHGPDTAVGLPPTPHQRRVTHPTFSLPPGPSSGGGAGHLPLQVQGHNTLKQGLY